MNGPFEIKVGTIGRLIACDECGSCSAEEWEQGDLCSHGRNNHKLVEVIEQYAHEDPAMETPCFVVRTLDGEVLDGVRMWDLERPSPLEELAWAAD